MKDINKAIMAGRVIDHPTIRATKTKDFMAEFRISVRDSVRDRDGNQVEAEEWYTIKTFGAIAEHVRATITKSDKVLIEGRFKIESWTNAAGEKRTKPLIIASTVDKLAPGPAAQGAEGNL